MNRRDETDTYILGILILLLLIGAAYFQWYHEHAMKKCEAAGVSAEDCWRLLK